MLDEPFLDDFAYVDLGEITSMSKVTCEAYPVTKDRCLYYLSFVR